MTVAGLALALGAGCATIIKGGMQTVNIRSNPSEAKVTITDMSGITIVSQNTPCMVSLKRGAGYFTKATYRVVVEKAGFSKFETMISGHINGWYAGGNLIFGGLIGYLILDPITGAMWTLQPEVLDANLAAQNASFLQRDGEGLVIVLKEQVPVALRAHMKPVTASVE